MKENNSNKAKQIRQNLFEAFMQLSFTARNAAYKVDSREDDHIDSLYDSITYAEYVQEDCKLLADLLNKYTSIVEKIEQKSIEEIFGVEQPQEEQEEQKKSTEEPEFEPEDLEKSLEDIMKELGLQDEPQDEPEDNSKPKVTKLVKTKPSAKKKGKPTLKNNSGD